MIYIVRHGQTGWNAEKRLQGHAQIALNEEGRQTAQILANKVQTMNIEKIISSDLLRAKETAEIINKKLDKEIIYDVRLRSIDYGTLEGRFIADISQEEWEIYNTTPEQFNAESVESVYIRLKSFFDEIIHTKDNVLIVAHGGIFRVMRYYIANREQFNNEKYCKYYKDAKQIENTALFKWQYESDKIEPIYY